jgi:hypothetical protein
MGVRTRGLDIANNAKRQVADAAAPERVNDFETPFVMRLASKRV